VSRPLHILRCHPELLLAAIIAAAVLTPGISVSERLPDIRVEQVLAVMGALMLGIPSPCPDRPGQGEGIPITLAFLFLAAATLLSIVAAPLVLGEPFSVRDGYEVVKLALYWVLFRFALLAGSSERGRRAALGALLAAGMCSALFALMQYFDWLGVRGRVGDWWAPAHHLRALVRDGRAFGTVGNPNYFGAQMALLTIVGLVTRAWLPDAARRLALGGIVAGALGVVLSGSRGALALLVVALLVVWAVAVWQGQAGRGLLRGTAVLGVAFALSVLLVVAFPRGREDYLSRVGGALSPTGDSALALRLERWRSALGWSADRVAGDVPGPPVSDTGRPSAGEAARARDARRKDDLQRLGEAVGRFRTRTGSLPVALDVLVPDALDALPVDPDGTPYGYDRHATGFTVTARIEDPADPDYPLLALGDTRNYLFNADTEDGNGTGAADFRSIAGTTYRRAAEAALYGRSGIVFSGNPSHPRRRAAVYQQRFFGRPGGGAFTAVLWVKLPRPVQGAVDLYVNILYTDGDRQDPAARVSADSSLTGVWQRLTLTVTPDGGRQVDFIGVYLLADDFAGEAYADGFELVDGSVPVRFTGLPESSGSAALGLDTGAQFRRSPLVGVGPRKAEGGGTVDNEYLLVLARYGLVGMAAYLALWAAVMLVALRSLRAGRMQAAAVAGMVAGLLVFNVVAGSLYHLQLMGVFWPVIGALLARPKVPPPPT
jgi:O-antigen ligase